jgi:DNA polymerase elongation subunit (family B)
MSQLKVELEQPNGVPLALLAITKQLTKNPEDYPDKKALPHVQVAIRMNSSMAKKFKQGDTIAYVICEVRCFLKWQATRRSYSFYAVSHFVGWHEQFGDTAGLSRGRV